MRTYKEKTDLINWFDSIKVGKDCPFAITIPDTEEYGTDIHNGFDCSLFRDMCNPDFYDYGFTFTKLVFDPNKLKSLSI